MFSAVCRVCRGRVGLLRVDTLKGHATLLESYETLTNRKVNAAGRSTTTMCFTCVSQLQRCHRLSDAAHRSNRIRQQRSTRGFEVTHTNITPLNLGTTQHLSVIALPHLTLKDNSNNENTSVTVKQEQKAVKEETMGDDLIDINGRNTEEVAMDDRSNDEGSSRASALTIHMQGHTGERPYACIECHKSFRRAGHLKKHMFIHTGERPYACNVCHKTFRQVSNLNDHMIVHTGERPYACNVCQKTCRWASNMKKHMTIHKRERSYACNECHKTFCRASDVKKHMIIHTGERPLGMLVI